MGTIQHAEEETFIALVSVEKEAIYHATCAAELYMKAVEHASTAAEKSRLYGKFNEILSYAQRVKDCRSRTSRRETRGDVSYTLHGVEYPPWEPPDDRLFCRQASAAPYIDTTDFKLSKQQLDIFEAWRRPHEIDPGTNSQGATCDGSGWYLQPGTSVNLVQDVTADCSVVASLCALSTLLQTGTDSSNIIASIFYPFDQTKGQPAMSSSGMHIFRMFFNGCFRKVVVDSRLPCSRTGRFMYVMDRQQPSLFWPALLEKAYLKVRGGYDFPGSNSATDLFVMTGWIPEQLFLQSRDFDADETWTRIEAAAKGGQLLITLGTGLIPQSVSQVTGLISEHNYAVLDLCTLQDGSRNLLVKNPWREGRYLERKDISASSIATPTSMIRPSTAFWMPFEDAVSNFESMYLNWDPTRFAHRQDFYFTWRRPPGIMNGSLAYNRQFVLTAHTNNEIWVLVSRHFSDEESAIAREKASSLALRSRKLGFMSIMAFDVGGNRVDMAKDAVFRTPFVDSSHALAQLKLKPGCPYTVVPVYQDMPLPEYSLSISFFSMSAVQVDEAANSLKLTLIRIGAWARRSAGGNASSPTYSQNPQYSITAKDATDLSILLSTDITEIATRVDLVYSNGQRVASLQPKNLVAHSGDYERGASSVRTRVDAGVYTVVCSAFTPGQLARFALRIDSDCPVAVAEIPSGLAGWVVQRLPPVTFALGQQARRIRIHPSRLTKATVQVRPAQTATTQTAASVGATGWLPGLKMEILNGWSPSGRVLLASSHHQAGQSNQPLSTPEFDIDPYQAAPDGFWILVTHEVDPASPCPVDVYIFSDNPVTMGAWNDL